MANEMRYFLVFGVMYNRLVSAKSENEVNGTIIREMTKGEAENYAKSLHISNAD